MDLKRKRGTDEMAESEQQPLAGASPASPAAAAVPPGDDEVNPKRRRGGEGVDGDGETGGAGGEDVDLDGGDGGRGGVEDQAEEEEEEEEKMIRLLFDSRDVGAIIGKGGSTIQELRASSGAHVDAGRHDPSVSQRVVTIAGTSDQVLRALALIVEQLQREWDTDEITVNMLVLHLLAGAVIGRGGAEINATRAETGANVRLSNEMLDYSSEKVLTVFGTPDCVSAALTRVAAQLLDQSPPRGRGVQLYEPRAAAAHSAGPPMHGAPGLPPPRARPPMGGGMPGMPPPGVPAFGAPPGGFMPQGPPGYGAAGAAGAQQQQLGDERRFALPVPQELVGALIGKRGATIQEIRSRSGANVKVGNEPEGADGSQRMVTITGNAAAADAALAMVYERLQQGAQY